MSTMNRMIMEVQKDEDDVEEWEEGKRRGGRVG